MTPEVEVTPRPRVFISSVIGGYEAFRDAAAEGISRANCQPLRAEDLPAGSASPRNVCLDLAASADAIVLLLGSRYGEPVASGVSATEEEYDEARRRHRRVFVFLEEVAEREPRQNEFVDRVQDYVAGHWRRKFDSVDELAEEVEAALQEAGLTVDHSHAQERAAERLADALAQRPAQYDGISWLQIVWTTLRNEEVVDPLDLDKDTFQQEIMHLAHGGTPPLLTYRQAKEPSSEPYGLRIQQGDPRAWNEARDLVVLDLYSNGTLSVCRNVTGARGNKGVGVDYLDDAYFIDPELLAERVSGAWAFAADWWNHIDQHLRHEPLLYQVALHDVGTRCFAAPPRSRHGGITIPSECPHNPLVAYQEARRVGRSELANAGDEVRRTTAMLERRFSEWGR